MTSSTALTSRLPGRTEILETLAAVGSGAARLVGWRWVWGRGTDESDPAVQVPLLYAGIGIVGLDALIVTMAAILGRV